MKVIQIIPVGATSLADGGVEVEHVFSASAYGKKVTISAGNVLGQHAHPHDHISVLLSGEAVVHVDGEAQPLKGLAVINITAGKQHMVQAITDIVWLCTHAVTGVDANTVDAVILEG
jgi:quercetin dioxygenase-like cupin family protein